MVWRKDEHRTRIGQGIFEDRAHCDFRFFSLAMDQLWPVGIHLVTIIVAAASTRCTIDVSFAISRYDHLAFFDLCGEVLDSVAPLVHGYIVVPLHLVPNFGQGRRPRLLPLIKFRQ